VSGKAAWWCAQPGAAAPEDISLRGTAGGRRATPPRETIGGPAPRDAVESALLDLTIAAPPAAPAVVVTAAREADSSAVTNKGVEIEEAGTSGATVVLVLVVVIVVAAAASADVASLEETLEATRPPLSSPGVSKISSFRPTVAVGSRKGDNKLCQWETTGNAASVTEVEVEEEDASVVSASFLS